MVSGYDGLHQTPADIEKWLLSLEKEIDKKFIEARYRRYGHCPFCTEKFKKFDKFDTIW